MEPHPMILRLIDDMPNPAYTPDHMSPLNPPLTFRQRVEGLWNILKVSYSRWTMADRVLSSYNNGYGPAMAKRGRRLPPFDEVKYNGSLVIGNSHVSSGLALQLPQNYIPVAGYHINPKVVPLPKNLQELMDKSSEGVIYFSMGSMMKGKTMPNEMKRQFLKTFSGLKQTVIWKLEEDLPNLPKNVHIVQWAPQQSILAHPNCVLFITHGGLLSTTETLHFGVPIIGIPLFADQFINTKRAVTKGFAIEVNIGYDTPAKLGGAIQEILGNPKYREKVKELSLIYHDRPVTPGQELVHWVEHVAKTRGAPHLRSPALNVPLYQKLYLDLLVVILLVILVASKVVKSIVSAAFGKKVKAKRS
ncbi:UDP-glycosyltransferase [Manduca sexta]|uniref:UDP-glucuronosyltransferase n=1 Tax=Manduca sexta TaxID=7130 RepID=A0A922CG00_MANSE|nr:UDP-glycosyltransferase [Manduca sexta]